MKLKHTFLFMAFASILFLGGCSKELEEYNKPAIYWYGKIVKYISQGDLERADNYYSSLQGEHIGSPLLPEATMILAIAHMHYEEYLLSEHFLNEYIKRYATINEKEDAEFLKIKAKYLALPNPRRDQALIEDAIKEAKKFKLRYPNSMYYALVNTMQTRLLMAEAALNETIADLYERLDKPKGAEYYRALKPQPWVNWDEIDRAQAPWYRAWFEGDGTQSWYGFMVPDTKSVVSRNSVVDDKQQATKEPVKQEKSQEKKKSLSQYQKDELQKAQNLRDKGIISEDEFESLREKILKL
ncbi:competence protein [Sulfurimonas hongkongensis]|uniref:Competence protein n=1 Tax=Sulfurimonas hongkongensis TaxID=1172190 RepID=T0KRS2_9BACT|nr:outer membrane protein assembly factor BamD [Sulfurimonas hongkongensis]EQB39654.1 competence protein [Sulfurimonas hongkongensis]